MPFIELQLHLANTDDAIASWEGEEKIHTKQGHLYVRAQEGWQQTATGWTRKYIWVRW